jgi:hypothetical protein
LVGPVISTARDGDHFELHLAAGDRLDVALVLERLDGGQFRRALAEQGVLSGGAQERYHGRANDAPPRRILYQALHLCYAPQTLEGTL